MSLFSMTDEQFEAHLKMLAEKKLAMQTDELARPASEFALEKSSMEDMGIALETKLRRLPRGFQLEFNMEDPTYVAP